MKRLFLATLALFIIVGGTLWFMGTEPKFDPKTLDKIKLVSRFKQILPNAEAGDAKAQFDIAHMYETGDGIRADIRQAVGWYKKAGEQGHAASQFQMGWMYANGIGLRQNYQAAAKWYRLAATFNNHSDAQFRLGEMHFNGRGVEHDYAKAIKYYTQAATKGHAAAQYLLGSMYQEGWGVKRDLIVAYMWLKMAVPNREAALAVNVKYDPAIKLERLKTQMNNFQIGEAEKRLVELAKRR